MTMFAPGANNSLFLDVDGSLIDIAPRPDDVVVPPGLLRNLASLTDALDGAIALVSGRSVAQLDRLFAPWRFRASGVHGAEMRFDPDGPTVGGAGAIPRAVWDGLADILRRFSGTLVENKTFSYAVHFRAVPAVADELEAALRALVEAHAALGLRLMPGHCVFEIKAAGFDKGFAVRRFMREKPFAGRLPIFIGDDVTDHPAFAAAIEAGGWGYGVTQDIPGTSGTFASPSAVREWLADLARKETIHA